MAIREGKWRCPYCSVVNRGADLKCTGCGATRDKDVAFFLEDEAPEVTDAALLAKAQAGADWLCQFCQTSNVPAETACRNCGAERGTAPSRPVRQLLDQPAAAPPPAPAKRRGCGCFLWAVAIGLALLAGFCWFSFRKSEDRVTVSGFEWERSIEVEARRMVRESAWEGEQPSGVRVLARSREVHHNDRTQVGTRKVKVGRKDLGNGFFEDVYQDQPVYRDEPVYRTRVSFEVERWVRDRTARVSGTDQSPGWPNPGLRPGEREAGRKERYVVRLKGSSRDYTMDLTQQRWASLGAGQSFRAVIQGGSRVLSLE